MTAVIETNAVFRCDAPMCVKTEHVPVAYPDEVTRDAGYDVAAEHLPVGWALVQVNAVGKLGQRTWVICSSDCMVEALDLGIQNSITKAMA